ncbi:ORF6N domain-containing protein [Acinetobacter ursingii]|uniref:ORF6N domain-containing protein n=1 Tax=Acinetobacter ursingii TaxID=108980 RepID=UPI003AF8EE6B
MNQIANINDAQISVVNFKSIPVVTTAMLAEFYGTEEVRIRQGHDRNKSRFIEGKHFFKITGQELKDFVSSLKILANFPKISNKARSLILWTERGAARHAKILDTDQAWDVFEQLEDCYFNRREILAKTHKSERTPLHDAYAMLVAKTKHLNSSDAWKIINQRFGTNHIEEIPYDQIPVAVEYVHHLIALYSNAEKKQFSDGDLHNLHALATHMIWAREWWRTFGDAIRTISPTAASLVHSHFADGGSLAWRYLHTDKREQLKNYVKDYDWFLPYSERRFIKS